MILIWMQACGKGVQTLKPMGKSIFDQEIQRTIGNGRLPPETFFRKPVKHLVRPHGAMRLEQDFQGSTPDRGQPRALSRHAGFGGGQCVGLARCVIMGRKGRAGIRRVCLCQFM